MRKEHVVKEVPVSFVRKLVLEQKTCPVCEKSFRGVSQRTYCSRSCRAKADYKRNAEAYKNARMERYRAEKKAAAGKK
jgi:hypothetical protein